ncbi:MAG: hypothetical protein DRI89_02685 [Bacteroidetes bacterium]|nr:MAG: hypothetical protein DRI89_02685 [Bacteroidota bacterium]
MKENTNNQLIEDYIDGLLKGKELADFQKRLETDTEFAKAYNHRIKLANLWQQADDYQKTKAQIRKVMDSESKSRFFNYRKTYYILAIAASVILLLGVYWLLSEQNGGLPWNQKNQMADVADTITFQMDKPDKLAKLKYVIQLISPENKQSFNVGDTIEFLWKSPVDTARIELLIKNRNNNETVFQIADYTKDHFSIASETLTPGEYTWSIQDTTNSRFFTIK